MSLMYAKESIILSTLKDIEENHRHTQEVDLASSNAWRSKPVALTANLADCLLHNTKLTSLNLSDCMLNDAALTSLSEALAQNSTLFHLSLANNKFTRPGLVGYAKVPLPFCHPFRLAGDPRCHSPQALATNTGLISTDLHGHRVNSEVCAAFLQTYDTNFTLCKLAWTPDVAGYNLRFTELSNRNREVDRLVREGKPFALLLPPEFKENPPELVARVVPNPDEDEYGLEVGDATGTMVWCSVGGRWELGRIEGKRGAGQRRKLVVTVEEVEHEIDPKDTTHFEPSHAQDLPNMVAMSNLHEAPLLYLLQRRLKSGNIYTWAGDVLLSLNPYASVANLYQVSAFLAGDAKTDATPHVYSVAKRALSAFQSAIGLRGATAADGGYVNQSVLVSGESGAGKTECCKRVLEYLTSASRLAKNERGGGDKGHGAAAADGKRRRASIALSAAPFSRLSFGEGVAQAELAAPAEDQASVEVLLREASPVLEGFGNAKTIRNDNSSRFGKYVAVQYSGGGFIVGASSETYLLERSRVVECMPGERNYHIFYQLLSDRSICSKWALSPDAADSMYLSSEPPLVEVEEMERNDEGRVIGTIFKKVREEGPRRVATVSGSSDAHEFEALKRGLKAFRVSEAEMADVWRIVSAVLLLGNVLFVPREGSDNEIAEVADDATIRAAAAALGCDVEALRWPMTAKKVTVVGESVEVPFTCKAAAQSRDALAKAVYSSLFDFVVGRINDVSKGPPDSHTIGILDIFGFEKLKTNSFEQLCINYVNEMLQEQFNERVFAAEERLCKAEGIAIDDSALQSSATRLSLMTRILSTLDEQCRLGERANDDEFVAVVGRTIAQKTICRLEQAGVFSIVHYAGKVFYHAEGFVMKNTDTLPVELSDLMLSSDGLGLLHGMLRAKVGVVPGDGEGGTPGAGGQAAAAEAPAPPKEMTMKERIAAMKAMNTGGEDGGTPRATATPRGGTRAGKKAGPTTLGGRLRAGIGAVVAGGAGTGLMGLLSTTTTHYVRCVKPNDGMAAFGFEQPRVLQQLQYSGVVEMVRIRRSGFLYRAPFAQFAARFRGIVPRGERQDDPPASALGLAAAQARCERILELAGLHSDRHFALGKSMVFLRNAVEGVLNKKLADEGELPGEPAPAPAPAPAKTPDPSPKEWKLNLPQQPPPQSKPQVQSKPPPPPQAQSQPQATSPAPPPQPSTSPPTPSDPAPADASALSEQRLTVVKKALLRRLLERQTYRTVSGMFNAVFGDDQDALALAIEGFPELLNVRQNRAGQHASLAHAAAAGGSIRVAPQLMLAMHAAAREAGSAAPPEEGGDEDSPEGKLRAAMVYCTQLRDVLGRTPLHYAARFGRHGFVQWAVGLLCMRELSTDDSLGMGGLDGTSAANREANELRRAVMGVRLPGAPPGLSGRKRMLVTLSPDALRLYALPAGSGVAGSTDETLAAQAASQEEPTLKVARDAFLFHKHTSRTKAGPKLVVQIVLLQRAGDRSSEGKGETLELHAESMTEARFWLVALSAATSSSNARATFKRVASLIVGEDRAASQLDLWERYTLVNTLDWRGEGMVHALVRGLEPGDESSRSRFLAMLLDQGAELLDGGSAATPDSCGCSALTLLLSRAASSASKPLDSALAALLSLLLRQASCLIPAAKLGAAVAAARKSYSKLAQSAPETHAALCLPANLSHGADTELVPPPPPSQQQQRLRLLLLSIDRLDCGAMSTRHEKRPEVKIKAPLAAVRVALTLVHQPAVEESSSSEAPRRGAGLGAIAAKANLFGGAEKPAGDDLGVLEKLVEEKVSAPALGPSPKGLLWSTTWQALQLPGEEAALVLLQFVHPEAVKKGAERLIGWVTVAADAYGSHHLQLRPPPLPKSAAEARAPVPEPLDLWVHCDLALGVTGSLARHQAKQTAGHPTAPSIVSRSSVLFAACLDELRHAREQQPAHDEPARPEQAARVAIPSPAGPPAAAPAKQPTAAPAQPTAAPAKQPIAAPAKAASSSKPPVAKPAPGGTDLPKRAPPPPPPPRGGEAASSVSAKAATFKVKSPPERAPPPPPPRRKSLQPPAASNGALKLLQTLPPPMERGKLPPRKFGKAAPTESRDEVAAILAAAADAASAGEFELGLRGFLRAFEVTRSAPLVLSAANMHLQLGELNAAQGLCTALREQGAVGLSAEQLAMLSSKESEIQTAQRVAKTGAATAGSGRSATAWQQKLQRAKLDAERRRGGA